MKEYIIEKGYSGVSLRWGTAFFKKVNYLITRDKLDSVRDCETWVYDQSKDSNIYQSQLKKVKEVFEPAALEEHLANKMM